MQELVNSLLDSGTMSCWTCGLFDSLFVIISNIAAVAYERLALFSIIIFCILFSFYIANAFWQNMKNGMSDPFLLKSVKPVLIKSLVVLTLLTMGIMIPRFISKITFEPVATLTLEYSKAMMLDKVPEIQNYTPIPINNDDGFFSADLRDTILQLIRTSIYNFQDYVKVGIGIIDQSFCISCLFGIGSLIRHIIVFFIGLFLTYNFIQLFIKYSFCFMDIIVAMAMFAFFFPLSLVLFIFKDASDLPGWMKNLGGSLGSGQIKKLINAIVSIASTILTYTIIMMVIRGYLDSNGMDVEALKSGTMSLFEFDLEDSDAMQLTFAGAIVLIYVVKYIADQVPEITKKIMSVFGVSQEDSVSKEMGESAWQLTKAVKDNAKQFVKNVVNPDAANANATGGAPKK